MSNKQKRVERRQLERRLGYKINRGGDNPPIVSKEAKKQQELARKIAGLDK